MSKTQLRRMDVIEGWRQKAFVLSRTDRLGQLIAKTFDLIQTVVRDGPNAEMLVFELEMIKAEQESAMKVEYNQNDIFRSLFYGLNSSLGLMIESIRERSADGAGIQQEMILDEQTDAIASEDNQMINGEKNNTTIAAENPPLDQGLLLGTPKVEETEIQIATVSVDELVKFELNDIDSLEQQNGNDGLMHEVDATSRDNDEVAESVDASLSEEPANSQPRRKRPRSSTASNVNKKKNKLAGNAVAAAVQVPAAAAATPTTPGAGKFEVAGEFPCSACGRTFANMASFRIHERTHKPERCNECGMRTESRESLHQHYEECHPGKDAETSERDNRTLSCSQCDKRIRGGPANLRDHERTHTGERPFKCSVCFKSFKASGKLHLHIRDDHGEKPFPCDHCELKFARRAEMQQHKQKDHRGHRHA